MALPFFACLISSLEAENLISALKMVPFNLR